MPLAYSLEAHSTVTFHDYQAPEMLPTVAITSALADDDVAGLPVGWPQPAALLRRTVYPGGAKTTR